MLFKKTHPDSNAVTFDLEATFELQKNSICTSPDRIFGYMFYLIRTYFGINQKEMGYSFHSIYKKKYINGLSKSAYSKVENGATSINFDLILIYSSKYGIQFQQMTELYNYLLHLFYHKNFIFLEACGYLQFGKHSGFIKHGNASNDYLYTHIKNYNSFFSKKELSELNTDINIIFSKAKEAILFEKECMRKNK